MGGGFAKTSVVDFILGCGEALNGFFKGMTRSHLHLRNVILAEWSIDWKR